jgi:hypothetical protein
MAKVLAGYYLSEEGCCGLSSTRSGNWPLSQSELLLILLAGDEDGAVGELCLKQGLLVGSGSQRQGDLAAQPPLLAPADSSRS